MQWNDFQSSNRKKNILPFSTTRVGLEDIISNHRRTNTSWLHLYEVSKTVKVIEAESRMVFLGNEGQGILFFIGYKVIVIQHK